MKTLLTLAKYKTENGVPVRMIGKPYVQESRSWVKGFLQGLYINHAELETAQSELVNDLAGGNLFKADCDEPSYGTDKSRGTNPNLFIAAGGGHGSIFRVPGAQNSSGEFHAYNIEQTRPFSTVGIIVGGDNTAVTPTDWKLHQQFGNGREQADASTVSIQKLDSATTPSQYEAYGTTEMVMFISPEKHFRLYSVKLKIYREGSPGTLTVKIFPIFWGYYNMYKLNMTELLSQTTDGDTLTTDTAGEWRELVFASQIDLVPGYVYGITLQAPSGNSSNSVHWVSRPSNEYWKSTELRGTSGTTGWASISPGSYQFYHELMGRNPGELEYGGVEISGPSTSGSTAEFNIRRYFTNLSGESRTVREVGLTGVQSSVGMTSGRSIINILYARDVLGTAITLANTEILLAQYTPKITV